MRTWKASYECVTVHGGESFTGIHLIAKRLALLSFRVKREILRSEKSSRHGIRFLLATARRNDMADARRNDIPFHTQGTTGASNPRCLTSLFRYSSAVNGYVNAPSAVAGRVRESGLTREHTSPGAFPGRFGTDGLAASWNSLAEIAPRCTRDGCRSGLPNPGRDSPSPIFFKERFFSHLDFCRQVDFPLRKGDKPRR